MAAQTVQEVEAARVPKGIGEGVVFERDGVWWAIWVDHAGRVIKVKLGLASDLDERHARISAFEAAARYEADVEIRNLVVDRMRSEDVVEMGHRADFPREVVARLIDQICRRLARAEGLAVEDDKKTPAIHLFVERTRNVDSKGMSARDVNRILSEDDRITVSSSVVDLICVEFDVEYSEVVESALEWSRLSGQWATRPGSRDPWPYGYKLQSTSDQDDLIL